MKIAIAGRKYKLIECLKQAHWQTVRKISKYATITVKIS